MYRDIHIHIYTDMRWTKEIGLKITTTANIDNEFQRKTPYVSNMFSRKSQIFMTIFTCADGVPVTHKIYQEN